MVEDVSARRFALLASLGICILSLVPWLIASFVMGDSSRVYLGSQTANDDFMVYAAWMRQAMEGRLLFDNRFAIEPQPGLTFHLYFLVLGWVAKLVGIPLALTLGRALFNGLLVWTIYQLLRRVTPDNYAQKFGTIATVFGAGLGSLAWENFGKAATAPNPLSGFLMGLLPTDVWQPEGFVFPSMLVNGLFTVSLCLVLGIFICVLDARESWKPVGWGAAGFLVLMNIHSYDVLIVTLALVGFLVASLVTKQADRAWVLRVVVMGLGAVPAALWFVYVLSQDPVFQARAATPTFSPNFRQVLFGYLPLIVLGGVGIYGAVKDPKRIGALALFLLVLFGAAANHVDTNQYWMTLTVWVIVFVVAGGLVGYLASEDAGVNLLVSWGLIGLVAPYFPMLFQRKLLMGLSVPWAILATLGFVWFAHGRERGVRNLAAVLVFLLVGGTSIQWVMRELTLARNNVSSTTVHEVYYSRDVQRMVDILNARAEASAVLIAMPGIPSRTEGGGFRQPYLPDLNPLFSGLTGVTSYAGHWSETPEYEKRRSDATRLFLSDTPEPDRNAILRESRATYLVAPKADAYPDFPQASGGRQFADLRSLGEVLVDGSTFQLIRITRPASTSN